MSFDPQALADQIAAKVFARAEWLAQQSPPASVRVSRSVHGEDVLRTIAPADYVGALTGVEVPASGVIRCPLPGHEDRTPSFSVYRDPARGWYYFGCGRGGSIFDFASHLWDVGDRGASFVDLRQRLAVELLRAGL